MALLSFFGDFYKYSDTSNPRPKPHVLDSIEVYDKKVYKINQTLQYETCFPNK